MLEEYPKKGKRNIIINGSPVEVDVLEYSQDINNFIIMQEAMYKLAIMYNVVIEELINCVQVEDNAFYINGGYNSVSTITQWCKCIRFFATYKINRNGVIFFGSGSASADDISDWRFKGHAYEIAHKRAKVNGIRQALGLFEYKIEDLDSTITSDSVSPVQSKPEYIADNIIKEENKPPTINQLNACLNIFKRLSESESYKNSDNRDYIIINEFSTIINKKELLRLFEEYIQENDIHIILGDKVYHDYLFSFFKEHLSLGDCVEIIKNCGDFSGRCKKP